MLVVDASAVLHALSADHPNELLVRRLSDAASLHAPHLFDVEVLNGLRRLVGRRQLTLDRAQDAITDLADLALVRYPHIGFADRIWALRANVTAYDAAYVALAEALDCPLVTSDARLGRARGHAAHIECYEAA